MARKARKGPQRKARFEDLRGERLAYGAPVTVGGRTVITVTRLRASRNGKGRSVDAAPMGYIEVTSAGSEYHAIEEPSRGPSRGLRAAAGAATTLVGIVAGARALRAARRPTRLLPPGRR